MTTLSTTIHCLKTAEQFSQKTTTVRHAACNCWHKLPDEVKKCCSKISITYRGVETGSKLPFWEIRFFFKVQDSKEFVILYHTARMGSPRDNHVLRNFTEESLSQKLYDGHPDHQWGHQSGVHAAFVSQIKTFVSKIDSQKSFLETLLPEELEVRESILPDYPKVCLVRLKHSTAITPSEFNRLCAMHGYTMTGYSYTNMFNKVYEVMPDDVSGLASLSIEPECETTVCQILCNETQPRWHVPTKTHGVWKTLLDSRVWFVVKKQT